MKAIVLAAGYATRMYPLTINKAKPLLPVGRKPLLFRILDKIESCKDIDSVVMVTNNRFFKDFQKAIADADYSLKIDLLNDQSDDDSDKLGAIKDIKFCIDKAGLDEDVLIVAGDNLFDADLNKLLEFSRGKDSVIGVHDIGSKKNAVKYGVVDVDKDSVITSFEEKPSNPKSSLIAICVYYLSKKSLAGFREYLAAGQDTDAPGHFVRWMVANRQPVYGYEFTGSWFDIGDINSYRKADDYYRKLIRMAQKEKQKSQ